VAAHVGTPLMDRPKRQTATATPAKPGGLPLTLGAMGVLTTLAVTEMEVASSAAVIVPPLAKSPTIVLAGATGISVVALYAPDA
jgi:hypothetical protein